MSKVYKWSLKTLTSEAMKYRVRTDFQKFSKGAYLSATRQGLLEKVCAHMPKRIDRSGPKNPAFKWTIEKISSEAIKYNSRKIFSEKSGSAYGAAIRQNILDQVCSHMPKNLSIAREFDIWNDGAILSEALKYKTRSEFKKSSPSAYAAARRKKILDISCKHMTFVRNYRNNDELLLIAKKYSRRVDLQKQNPSAYQALFKRGLVDVGCSHMKQSICASSQERELFDFIKSIYPKAQKLKDRKVNILNKPHIQGFEIDIYIPELRKGVEFDGKYWHSHRGLKRSRQHWPEKDILNYHELKDQWFASKGIKILHIREEDWYSDSKSCLDKCLIFFKNK